MITFAPVGRREKLKPYTPNHAICSVLSIMSLTNRYEERWW